MAACNYNDSELGPKQRKDVQKCDPGEKRNTENMASYSLARLNHRFFNCIATKMDNCILLYFASFTRSIGMTEQKKS